MGRSTRTRFWKILTLALWTQAAAAADWSQLQRYDRTLTQNQFLTLLETIYAPSWSFTNYLALKPGAVVVYSSPGHAGEPLITLNFAKDPASQVARAGLFKNIVALTKLRNPTSAPLRGIRIALDPGHIGGEWARVEERFFVRGNDRPVQEAVLNLTVARLLRARLEAAGATVSMTKDDFQPVTEKRPEDFRRQAEAEVSRWTRFDAFPPLEREAAIADAIRKRSEVLFYRSAEIAARARRVNTESKLDLTVCVHFNAVEWNERFDLVEDNRLVVFVHGNYLSGELVDDDQKFRLLAKLLEDSHAIELPVAEAIATSLAAATKLPPVDYGRGGSAIRVGSSPYVYARNLAANRLCDGPVVFLEPYYQNNRIVYQRIQLGDYEGERIVDGTSYRSIYREYADAVAEGVIEFYGRYTVAR